ncbi:MAG: type II toxin-antitoxin system MqsA family antitoxin [Ignavibacteria bacterium]|nr:type II toxin-antitoxin system MqsA family antitoxin [Ignavibacteria bacterium]MCU7500825.1 type II toxin-antitoxin system MqsA family antitoxin [Ignavibacteria bacterium]MCU7511813.1 type II toxin-antitoxin system MqsA family antitoxin [Ignavibacteria bacterium]MCU7520715.1 type II toxin-antitoxin system MqsA family antitoxin [Ignavibacteria bacterium]MCU7526085.1 type II toxin-antitoxin system MqsA family antitoxin [Ignavibacteria bacterium]
MFERNISENDILEVLKHAMKCVICKSGETQPGRTVVTLTRGEFVIVFKNVPAGICQNCGEEYVNDKTTAALLSIANDSFEKGVVVDVRDYKAA